MRIMEELDPQYGACIKASHNASGKRTISRNKTMLTKQKEHNNMLLIVTRPHNVARVCQAMKTSLIGEARI